MSRRAIGPGLGGALALLALLAAAGLLRPLLPIDETRYAAVAWEMWLRGEWLVPHLNGQPYSHKAPLLFWMIHAGWAVFGVHEGWLRLIGPLLAAGTLVLTARAARLLWPERPAVAEAAPLVLVSSALFAYFATALMFDLLLSLWVTLGWLALLRAWRHGTRARDFVLLGAALGGALLAKGPAALVHLLPVALAAPWWMREQRPAWRRWYAGVGLALVGGAALALAWAIPAGLVGGPAYREAIFWGQTAGRMVRSFAHQGPWWYYLPLAPLLLAPWLLWPRWWRALAPAWRADSGLRFVLLGALITLLVFSLVSGKRPHYLLPAFPLVALLVVRALDGDSAPPGRPWGPALSLVAIGAVAALAGPWLGHRDIGVDDVAAFVPAGLTVVGAGVVLILLRPAAPPVNVRRLALAAVVGWAALGAAAGLALRETHDVQEMGRRLAQYEREGREVAVEARLHDGQWIFAGRLRRPLVEMTAAEIPAWLAADPTRRAIVFYRHEQELPAGLRTEVSRRYRGVWMAVLAP